MENGEITNDPPALYVIQCVRAPDVGSNEKMMIANGAAVLRHGLNSEQRDWLSERQSVSSTPQNQAFGGNVVKKPLVVHNEHTGHDVLRWVETW